MPFFFFFFLLQQGSAAAKRQAGREAEHATYVHSFGVCQYEQRGLNCLYVYSLAFTLVEMHTLENPLVPLFFSACVLYTTCQQLETKCIIDTKSHCHCTVSKRRHVLSSLYLA